MRHARVKIRWFLLSAALLVASASAYESSCALGVDGSCVTAVAQAGMPGSQLLQVARKDGAGASGITSDNDLKKCLTEVEKFAPSDKDWTDDMDEKFEELEIKMYGNTSAPLHKVLDEYGVHDNQDLCEQLVKYHSGDGEEKFKKWAAQVKTCVADIGKFARRDQNWTDAMEEKLKGYEKKTYGSNSEALQKLLDEGFVEDNEDLCEAMIRFHSKDSSLAQELSNSSALLVGVQPAGEDDSRFRAELSQVSAQAQEENELEDEAAESGRRRRRRRKKGGGLSKKDAAAIEGMITEISTTMGEVNSKVVQLEGSMNSVKSGKSGVGRSLNSIKGYAKYVHDYVKANANRGGG